MAIVTNLDLLRRVPLFSLLTAHQAEALGSAVSKRRFKRGEALVVQGQKSDALYLLLTGRARVSASDTRGREVILATLMPGDYLGEMSIIDNEPHSASVHALVQTDVLALGRAEFTRCLAENVSMSLVVMRGDEMVGMLTFREVLLALKGRVAAPEDLTVGEVMVAKPVTAYPDMEANDLRRLMIEKHSRYLPGLDGDTLMGVISFLDVAKAVLAEQLLFITISEPTSPY